MLLGTGEEDSATEAPTFDAFVDHADAAKRDRTIAVAGFVAGGVLGVLAIVRYGTRDGDEDEGTSVSVAPAPGGFVLGVGGSF